MTQCTAKSKRTGERCGAQAVTGRTVCYHHGGKSPLGPASPSFKSGRYSKVLPGRLLERYETALQDGELLALREEIGLIDARLADLLGRLDTGESGAAWQAARAAADGVRGALLKQDPVELATALNALETALDRGQTDYVAWQDVGRWVEQRRKTVESERKRLVEMRQMLTAEQAMTFMAAVMDVVRRNVSDRNALAEIAAELTGLSVRAGGNAAADDE